MEHMNPRSTKIICTIGPASDKPEIIKSMIEAGMNVARFNMSHGDYADHERRIKMVRKCADELSMPIGLLLDTKGPEVRVKTFKNGKVEIKDGQKFTFTSDDVVGDNTKVSITHKDLPLDLKKGDIIMVNDGLLKFEVDVIRSNSIVCQCLKGGVISNKKSMNFPNIALSMPYLSEIDRQDILFGIKMGVDFIAASFVSNKDNVLQVKQLIDQNGARGQIDVISKIENRDGVKNIDEILQVSDGIMIARGDMGVEIPFVELPEIQKELIHKAKLSGKSVIVATEMLESMIENPRPTRAETSDIANAVYDGASCIMLSGETAAGKYPVECVSAMSKIARETEHHIDFFKSLRELDFVITNTPDAISHAACHAAHTLGAKLIIAFTHSGYTPRMVSRFRPGVPIIAATPVKKAYNKLSLVWGVVPMIVNEYNLTNELFELATYIAHKANCHVGDTYIVTASMPIKQGTNMMKVCILK